MLSLCLVLRNIKLKLVNALRSFRVICLATYSCTKKLYFSNTSFIISKFETDLRLNFSTLLFDASSSSIMGYPCKTNFLLNLLHRLALLGLTADTELTKKLSEREEMFEKRFQSTFKLHDKVRLSFSSFMRSICV